MKPLEGYQLEREGSHAVALDLALDDELRREGLAREVVHAVQSARATRAWPSRTASRSRSAATRSCWRPRARTRTTWPARRWPTSVSYDGSLPDGELGRGIDGRELRIGVERA